MRAIIITTALLLITASAASASTQQLTDMHMQRCRDTVASPTSTQQQRKYACNPTGTDANGIYAPAMQAACRSFLHPEWYASFPGRRPVDPNWEQADDSFVSSWMIGTPQLLPSVTTETSTATTDCGTKPELDDLRQDQWEARELAKGKPVAWAYWACTTRADAQKPACYWNVTKYRTAYKHYQACTRKAHGRKQRNKCKHPKIPTSPTNTVSIPDASLPSHSTSPGTSDAPSPAAQSYASAVWSLVSGCSRTSLTYADVLQRSKTDAFWTSKCSTLYYDKLRSNVDAYNATQPDGGVPYPSRLIVQQVENVYLKHAGTAAEIANVNCWLAWGRNTTSQPIPTGCAG